jgi:uncharacterized protein (TIGR03083 family)
MSEPLAALRSSVEHLAELVTGRDESGLVAPSYDTEWKVADVLSHIGSGAVIMQRRLEDSAAGRATPAEFAPAVWDEWNAKSPLDQRDSALAADRAFLAAADALTVEQRRSVSMPMGPMALDFDTFIAMRLNEHALHTWDIEVMDDSAAVVGEEQGAQMVDRLEVIARFTAKPTGSDRKVAVRTSDPERLFTIVLSPERVDLVSGSKGDADLEMPAESFARLIYGRLDADHTPPSVKGPAEALDELRSVYPGP